MQNPKTFFDEWLEEILKCDPHYKFNIVCNYYDECGICPMRLQGRIICDELKAMNKLDSIVEGNIENDN